MTARTKTYFASDLHLGSPYHDDPRAAEQRFVRWLRSIEGEAKQLILWAIYLTTGTSTGMWCHEALPGR